MKTIPLDELRKSFPAENVQVKNPLTKAEKHTPTATRQEGEYYFRLGTELELAVRLKQSLDAFYGGVVYAENSYWVYSGMHWQILPEKAIKRHLHAYDGAKYGERGTIKLSKVKIDGVLSILNTLYDDEDFFHSSYIGINCLSGFVRFNETAKPELISHDKEHRQRFTIQAHWPPEKPLKTGAELLLNVLINGCFEGDNDKHDKLTLLSELMGAACLSHATRLASPKAVVLYGHTAENGKSQILKLMRFLIPSEAIVSISPSKFDDDHYKVQFAGKVLNACDELSGKAIASDSFKQMITGEKMSGCAKYQAPIFFEPKPLHVFATNLLPPFKSGFDRGVKRRLLIIPFNRSIPNAEKIDNIAQKIAEQEGSYLLDFAITGAQRLLQQGAYTRPQSSQEALLDWVYQADPVQAWFDECCEDVADFKTKTSDAYEYFTRWAEYYGHDKRNLPQPNNFSQRLKSIGCNIQSIRCEGGARFFSGFRVIKQCLGDDDFQRF